MTQGKALVEQVTTTGELVTGCDNILTSSEILNTLKEYFPNIEKNEIGIIGNYQGFKYSIRVKNITYLGNPHPVYKKRIQI